jgi:DNA replication and repair protein RecF
MWLERLELTDYRCYEKISIDFERRLTFITGDNASGKTNLLESISLLSLGKSFRGASDKDLVRHGQNSYYISGRFRKNSGTTQLEYAFQLNPENRKKIKINNKVVSGRSELIGNLVTVIFSPSDIRIIEGGPAERRRFIDILLSSKNPQYLENLIKYNRALKQRNVILKKIRERKERPDSLSIWDRELIKYGIIVIAERQKFINNFKQIFNKALNSISNEYDNTELKLLLSSPEEETDFAGLIKKNYYKDIASGTTNAGPHRHNLKFILTSKDSIPKDILTVGSQGQKRSTALALRIAEFYYLKEYIHMSPLLLIDDVIRELDAVRRAAFIKLLHESGQAIFTTPDLDGLEDFLDQLKDDIHIIKIQSDHTIEK